ncbi:MAG: hypothetical protein QXF04_01460 [Candidatus Aenigmatarchaeota archaeon]
MAKKEVIKEVFIPKWLAWFNLILMILITVFILYINSVVPENEKIPTLGLVMIILIFIIVIVIVFLSAYKKLPIYYLRER